MKLKTFIKRLQTIAKEHPEYNDFRIVLESYRGDYYNFDIYSIDNPKDKSIVITGNRCIEEAHKHTLYNIEDLEVNKTKL